MSETLKSTSPERSKPLDAQPEKPTSSEYTPADKAENIEQAQAAVEASMSERSTAPQLPVIDDRPHFIDHAIKTLRMRHNLTKVQQRLSPADQRFSKVVHQPLVSKVSSAAAQTVSRPSGLLGGGVAAFIGSLVYLYLAHHIGFEYNYLLFLGFFGGGFALGVAAEYIAYWLRRSSTTV